MASPRSVGWLIAAVLVFGACTSGGAGPSTTTTTTTTTTLAIAIRTTAPSSVRVASGVEVATADALGEEIDLLRGVVESLRGLGFLGPPQLVIETPAGFIGRWGTTFDTGLDAPLLAAETRLFRLLGLLGPGEDLRALTIRNVPPPEAAFYDPVTRELVVSADAAPLGPGARAEVVGQLTRALTDQYHDHTGRISSLREAGDFDGAEALEAIALADGLHTALRYIESLPRDEQEQAVAGGVAAADAPEFVAWELALVGDSGIRFVDAVLQSGGTAALDAAYTARLTTESILHPVRFIGGEGVLSLETPVAELPGYTLRRSGTFGEVGLRSILSGALSPGVLTETADGWGADHAALFDAGGDVAFGYIFRGDGVDDTVEVAQAFLDHAAQVMGLVEPVAAGGGVEIVGLAVTEGGETTISSAVGPQGPYVFVDRTGDVLVVIIASDPEAGRTLRSQLER